MLPHKWNRTDEWYNFRSNPRSQVHVLLTLNEATYQGGTMGRDHPISWYHDFDGGHSWYTGMGHTEASFQDPLFQAHIWGGIMYAANLKEQS
jgi:type 1 glutamine amidotransferase